MGGTITATMSVAIAMSATTSTTIIAANDDRNFLYILNAGTQAVWVKLQAAAVDNDKKGILIAAGGDWEMPVDSLYLGAVSGIADADAPDIYYTEY